MFYYYMICTAWVLVGFVGESRALCLIKMICLWDGDLLFHLIISNSNIYYTPTRRIGKDGDLPSKEVL